MVGEVVSFSPEGEVGPERAAKPQCSGTPFSKSRLYGCNSYGIIVPPLSYSSKSLLTCAE